MSKKLPYILLAIGILIVIIAAIAAFSPAKKCDYNDPLKTYLKNETPCIINFLCIRDRVAFSDECGCGCKVANSP
jgi:hypothetical protein